MKKVIIVVMVLALSVAFTGAVQAGVFDNPREQGLSQSERYELYARDEKERNDKYQEIQQYQQKNMASKVVKSLPENLGYEESIKRVQKMRKDISNLRSVGTVQYVFKKCTQKIDGRSSADQRRVEDCISSISAATQILPGTNINPPGSAHIVDGNREIDFVDGNLLRYSEHAADGLNYIYTFNINITTIRVDDGSGNHIVTKINHTDPGKTRLVDVNLPVSMQTSMTKIYDKRGISLTEKAVITALEDWYKIKMSPDGVAIQDMITGVLTDVDSRDNFIQFVLAKK